jgi:hypothetical protein
MTFVAWASAATVLPHAITAKAFALFWIFRKNFLKKSKTPLKALDIFFGIWYI